MIADGSTKTLVVTVKVSVNVLPFVSTVTTVVVVNVLKGGKGGRVCVVVVKLKGGGVCRHRIQGEIRAVVGDGGADRIAIRDPAR